MRRPASPLFAVATFLLTACGGAAGGSTGGATGDGNDTPATAQSVAIGATTSGVISSSTDHDWFKFTTTGPGTITVTLSGLTADADVELYDAAQALLSGSHNVGTATDTATWTAAGAGTFYALVVPMATAADYTLTVAFTPGADNNDTFATAQPLTLGAPTPGIIASLTDDDWYAFSVTGAGAITVTLTALSADANLAFHDAGQALLATSSSPGTASETVTWMAPTTGTYYVHVIPVVAGAAYTITASFVSGVVVDGNDTFATAQAVNVGSSFVAIIASATDEDWYKFTTAGAGTITVTLSGLSADADLELYGNVAAIMVDFSYMGGTLPDTVSYTATGPVTYHVRVLPRGAVTPYTLTIGFTP